jgi:hypothetical protein
LKNCNAPQKQDTRGVMAVALPATLAMALILSMAQPARADEGAHADELTPPPVPAILQIPPGNTVVLVGHAVGTQNYICLPSGTGVHFTLFTPQATLFNSRNKQLITHYYSPDPFEAGAIRATGRPGTRAPSGVRRRIHPQIPISSSQVQLPGCGSKWLGPRKGRQVVIHSRRLPTSNA